MRTADRKAAVAAYKERNVDVGIFSIHCAATGQVWVGESLHLDTQQNGLWFALRLGSHPNRGLQAAWNEHGEGRCVFEVLERIDPSLSAYLRRSTLKERAGFWRGVFGAQAV